jgi:hypothetical protein
MGKLVSERKKYYDDFYSGKKQTFVKARQKFYLQLKITDPKDPSKLVEMPKGVRVRLFANGSALKNAGGMSHTDKKGKVCLAPDSATIRSRPDYHFRIDLNERTYIDIQKMKLVPSQSIKLIDSRKLMEIPMVADTAEGGFHYDAAKLKLTDGKLKDYAPQKKGEGTNDAPIVLELRFYWYHIRLKYLNYIKNAWADVPAGLPLVPRPDKSEDYLHKYLLKDHLELDYLIDSEEKKIQHHLNLLGFNCGKVDGNIGAKARKAIRAFKKQYGLKRNAVAGPITKRMLEQVFYRRQVGVYDNGVYAIPVWKKKTGTWSEMHFEIAAPAQTVAGTYALVSQAEAARFDLFLYSKDKRSTPKLMRREEIAQANKDSQKRPVPYDRLEFIKQRHYYDLPVEWSSRNYWARYDNDMKKGDLYHKVMKEKVKLYPFVSDAAKRSDKTKPLVFSLDDIVLIKKSNGSQNIKDKTEADAPIDLKKDAANAKNGSRLSLFYVKVESKNGKRIIDLSLHAPEKGKQPFFSKVHSDTSNFAINRITYVPENPVLVAFANDFYTISNKRAFATSRLFKYYHKSTTDLSFDTAKHVKGCRVAVLNDTDRHAGAAIKYPAADSNTRYFAAGTGNYELHYLHNCFPMKKGPDKLEMQSFLIIYWNGKFVKKDYIGNVTLDTNGRPQQKPDTTHPMSDNDVFKYETEGLTNSKERWEQKGYTIEPLKTVAKGGTCKIQIKPVFFFEAKRHGIGGKPKCKVEISNDKNAGSMGISKSWMFWPDYKKRNYLGVGQFTDIDGKRFETLVISHELGHAEGKDDDYSYDDRFKQYYSGMPYQYDTGSMMNTNRAPRMRNLWNFLNWVNDNTSAAGNNSLKDLLGSVEFKMVHRYKQGGKDKTLNYHLSRSPKDYRDVYKPFKAKANKSVGTGKVDLALYRLGEDETAPNMKINKNLSGGKKPIQFDGILTVYIKVGFRFVDAQAPSRWTKAIKQARMNAVVNAITKLNDKFYITSTSGIHDFNTAVISFFPVCIESNSASRHYRLTVTIENPMNGNTIWTANGARLSVGHNTCEYDIISYLLGHARNNLARKRGGAGIPNIVKNDLEFIRKWFRAKLNDTDNKVTLVEV